jgi:SAM-dependent methyltransferase
MDVFEENRRAWDREVERGNRWTVPVSPEQVERARLGKIEIVLTPTKPIPNAWLEPLAGRRVLCLASGGGQQGPLLAAAGADVTVYDASPRQLAQDRSVAEREGLALATVLGDMADLSALADDTFDLIVHPCSNCFAERVRPVWKEAFRVLRRGGALLAGFMNPISFLFDGDLERQGVFTLKHGLPHSDLDLGEDERRRLFGDEPICFAHSLTDQIAGQLEAGFVLTGFYEDVSGETTLARVDRYFPCAIATRAEKR